MVNGVELFKGVAGDTLKKKPRRWGESTGANRGDQERPPAPFRASFMTLAAASRPRCDKSHIAKGADQSPTVPRATAPALPGSALGTFRTPTAFAGCVVRGVVNMAGRYQGFHSLNTGNIEIFWRADGWCWWSRAPGCPSVSAPVGPFLTSTDAYLNANGGACLIPRPARLDRVA